jgi:hypothetical protein
MVAAEVFFDATVFDAADLVAGAGDAVGLDVVFFDALMCVYFGSVANPIFSGEA